MPREAFVCVWVDEGDRLRVEHQPCVRPTIQTVTHDRHADATRVRSVDAQLVRAAGLGHEQNLRAPVLARQYLPFGDRCFAVFLVDDLPRPVVEVDTQGQLDRAAFRRYVAVEPRDVALVDRALRKAPLQCGVGVQILRDQ